MRPGRHLTHLAPVHAPNAALLIDFDNVTLGIRSDLTKELKTLLNSDIIKGKVAVQRAYADWRRYPQYIVSLSEASIDLIFAPAFGSNKKNATDIRLAVDAIELVFTRPEIGTFILLSGDSDFSSMVLKLKEYGKYVIGVGIRESASDLLIQNCDEYYSYNDLAGLSKEQEVSGVARDPWELAREAVAQMARNGDVMRSDRLKQVMQQLDANFDERDLGFSRFSKFVLEAAGKGLIQATKLENGQFEVAPLAAATAAPAAPTPLDGVAREEREDRGRGRRRGRGRERGTERGGERAERPERGSERSERGDRGERPERAEGAGGRGEAAPRAVPTPTGQLTLARAFQLMNEALHELGGPVGHEALRLRMSALLGREDALLEAGRFGRLLRQANDAEVADVRKLGEDEYEVALPRGAARMMPPAGAAPLTAAAAPPAEAAATAAVQPSGETTPAAAAAAPTSATVSPGAGGLRFRRGSRSPLRPIEIPLIGVFRADTAGAPAPAAESVVEPVPSTSTIGDAATTAADTAAEEAPAEGGRGRGGRGRGGRAKKAGGAPAAAAAPAAVAPAAAAPSAAPSAAPKEAKRAKGGAGRKNTSAKPAGGRQPAEAKGEAKTAAKSTPKSTAKSAPRPRAKAKG